MPWWGYLIVAVAALWAAVGVIAVLVWSRAARSISRDFRHDLPPSPGRRVDRTYEPRKP